MDVGEAKRQAALAALDLLPEEGIVGLGSGSTAKLFIDEVGKLVKAGRRLTGVPTSDASRRQAESLGIPLLDDAGPWTIDVCVDGADEVSDALDLIKGGGGCHTREKIVNHASKTNVIVVDDSKLSRRLGERWKVPVEVLKFGHESTAAALGRFGAVERRLKNGAPYETDSGNFIYDVHAGVLDDPAGLERALSLLPGVVDSGLFVGRADIVLIAGSAGVEKRSRR